MSDTKKIIVIGGSAAGPKVAARARRLDQFADIKIVQKDPDLSMAACGYPYYVGGFFDDRNKLLSTPTGATRDSRYFLSAKGIDARVETEVVAIDRANRQITCKNLKTGEVYTLPYDKLVLTTGAIAKMPPIPGKNLAGITTLQSMQDADYLRKIRDEKKVKKAVVIGGGLIGIETCEALQLAGIEITVIELLPQILTFLDCELAHLLENYVKTKANVITNNGVAEFLGENGVLTGVKLSNGTELPCELAVVAIGVTPNVALARQAGIEVGETGGIKVNEFMQTSDPDIYAAGDCVELKNKITGQPTTAFYGDLANLEGRVVADNLIYGNKATFPGTVHTGICKVFDYSAGSTGLSEAKAKAAGFDVTSVIMAGTDKPGFMGGKLLISKMVAETQTGRMLGFQCIGAGNAVKQIAQAAMAVQAGMTVEALSTADLPYAPPFSLAIDNFIATAHVLQNKMRGLVKSLSCDEVKTKVDNKADVYLLDVRSPQEYEEMRLGIGETLIPLGALRTRLQELPQDKAKEIICFCKISLRGYEAARLLEAHGWNNVKIMEGGISAWPYPREK